MKSLQYSIKNLLSKEFWKMNRKQQETLDTIDLMRAAIVDLKHNNVNVSITQNHVYSQDYFFLEIQDNARKAMITILEKEIDNQLEYYANITDDKHE